MTTPREIAEKVVQHHVSELEKAMTNVICTNLGLPARAYEHPTLINAIEEALEEYAQAERERCAKIAESYERDDGLAEFVMCRNIAKAIRESHD
jgi:hypothetical protein